MFKIINLLLCCSLFNLTVQAGTGFSSLKIKELAFKSEHDQELYNAILENDIDKARLALQAGADANNRVSVSHCLKQSLLHLAVCGYNIGIVNLLLEYGADINICNECGRTPLVEIIYQSAQICGYDEKVDIELAHSMINFLLENKDINVDQADLGLNTPLHWAVMGNFPKIVELLLAKGADINQRCRYNHTPLEFIIGGYHTMAAVYDFSPIIELLQKKQCENQRWDGLRSAWVNAVAVHSEHGD